MHKHKDTVVLEYCNCRSVDSIVKPQRLFMLACSPAVSSKVLE